MRVAIGAMTVGLLGMSLFILSAYDATTKEEDISDVDNSECDALVTISTLTYVRKDHTFSRTSHTLTIHKKKAAHAEKSSLLCHLKLNPPQTN
jgi:hypothetical protein